MSESTFDFTKEPGKRRMHWYAPDVSEALISVVTAYYNAGKYFEQTFNAVMNQTFPWFEWIIVDDGSTREEDIDILHRLASQDPRIKIVRQENGGLPNARNTGIRHASTEFIVPLDADDLIAPTFLECLYWCLRFNPDAAWAYTANVGFQDQQYLWQVPFDSEKLKKENFLVATAMIRKKDLLQVGCYEDSVKHFYEDWHLWLRMLSAGMTPVRSSLYGFWYRRSDTGVLAKVNTDKAVRKVAQDMIRQAAAGVDRTAKAKEYPCSPDTNRFPAPHRSTWQRRREDLNGRHSVLLIVPWMQMGGVEMFELELLRKIDKEKFHVTVATTVDAPFAWRQRFEEYTDDIFELPTFLDMENYGEFISYLIQSRNVQLTMVTNSYYGYYLMPWLRWEFPEMALIDYVHMEEWYWRRGGYARISGVMRDVTEHTYVCNQSTERAMIQHFGKSPDKVSTLYIGVDQEKFSREKVSAGQCRKKLNIPEDRKIILFPCRMDAQKRPFLMLRIAQEAKRRNLPVVFVAAGDGPLLKGLKDKCRELGLEQTVRFAGWKEDLRPFYRDAAITLNCSIREGLALTAYESCAMGVPVISTDVGGQRELIDDRTGKILPVFQEEAGDFGSTEYTQQEIDQFADAIEELLADEVRYREKCILCRKRIEEEFSTDLMVQNMEQVFLHFIQDEEAKRHRRETAKAMEAFSAWVDEFPALSYELEARDAIYQHGLSQGDKNELMRIANSKWGRRLIKIFFKLRLNKLLH